MDDAGGWQSHLPDALSMKPREAEHRFQGASACFGVKAVIIMKLFRRKEQVKVDFDRIPEHIAIIMDGNGRWAKKRGMPRTVGHSAGAEAFRNIANYCKEIGVHYLTVYAFSTENWKRPQEEVDAIMRLLDKYLHEAIEDAKKNQTRIVIFGDLSPLTPQLRALCDEARQVTACYEGCQTNICLNYGGRDEIVHALRDLAQECVQQGRDPATLTEDDVSAHLYSAGVPDPELVIRPSGEIRVSNFLLWQSAYSEYYFTDVLWPDFSKEELLKAIAAYPTRARRFGGV
jgi:undecaprenyl diphosphate synthase